LSKKIIVIGGAGKACLISQTVEDNRRYFDDWEFEVAGYMNDFEVGKVVQGYPVVGALRDVPRFLDEGYYFAFAIHLTARNYKTEDLFEQCQLPDERLPNIISRRAFVASTVRLAPGAAVMPFASISHDASIGRCAMVSTRSFVGHDTQVGPLCHLTATCVVGSQITIGKVATIGLHATVIEHCQIGDYALVGAAALVTKNIPAGQVWAGQPARYFRDVRLD
jgi:acetyltransferase EpsM